MDTRYGEWIKQTNKRSYGRLYGKLQLCIIPRRGFSEETISENRSYEMDKENYKLADYDYDNDYEWDYTVYSIHNDSIDSIDAEYYPELEWAQQPIYKTSTPKMEKTYSANDIEWLLA